MKTQKPLRGWHGDRKGKPVKNPNIWQMREGRRRVGAFEKIFSLAMFDDDKIRHACMYEYMQACIHVTICTNCTFIQDMYLKYRYQNYLLLKRVRANIRHLYVCSSAAINRVYKKLVDYQWFACFTTTYRQLIISVTQRQMVGLDVRSILTVI